MSEVDEHRRAIELLEEQNFALLAVVNSQNTPVFSLDRSYCYTSYNRAHASAMKALYGANVQIGCNLLDYMTIEEDKKIAKSNIDRALQGDHFIEYVFIGDNERINFEISHSPIEDASKNIVGISIFAKDVTERKKAEGELIRYRAHLEEMVKERTVKIQAQALQLEQALEKERDFSALQRKFVSLVSHEFRTPLAIIDGTAQRLARGKKALTPEFVKKKTEKIRTAVGRMVDLIENTLYAARLESGVVEIQPAAIDLGGMIRDLSALHGEVSPDHNITVDVDGLPRSITADEKLLSIVYNNLLSNAIKFAPDAPAIGIKGWTEGEHAVVSVTDQGLGIPDDELPHMFERFFRARTAEGIKGTGIGLNVSKDFVEKHGGAITVDSVEGEGAIFTVRLPISGKDQ